MQKLLAMFAVLVVCASPGLASEPLKAPAIRKMIPGRYEASAFGFRFDIQLYRDGAVLGRFGKWQDKGRWSIRDDKLCIALSDWTDNAFRCAPILKSATGHYRAGPFTVLRK